MGAETTDEIEVTPEMIEAGVQALLSEPGGVNDGIGFFSPPDLATRIFLAMLSRRFPNTD